MTERDSFEPRFAAAVRGYVGRVSSDLDTAELAHRIATSEPRRRGFAATLGSRTVAIPRVAWILLLLAALLTALAGEMLLAGTHVQRRLPAILPPVGQVFACPPGSTPDKPGPVDQARPTGLTPTGAAMAFDRRAGRLVALVIADAAVETWTFDVCTNTWTRMHPEQEPPSFNWARLVYDVDSDVTIGVFSESARSSPPGENHVSALQVVSSRVWAYDLQASTWTEKSDAPPGAWLLGYDPVSGQALADGAQLWHYRAETETWTPIQQANGQGGAFAYDPFVDRLVAYTGVGDGANETWLLDIRTGRWSKSNAVTPHVLDWLTLPAIAYDEAAERTVVGGNVRLAAYDATADRWQTVEFPGPDPWHGVSMAYDPVNERLVVLPDSWESWTAGTSAGVVALDLVTHRWSVLLEPGGKQPAP